MPLTNAQKNKQNKCCYYLTIVLQAIVCFLKMVFHVLVFIVVGFFLILLNLILLIFWFFRYCCSKSFNTKWHDFVLTSDFLSDFLQENPPSWLCTYDCFKHIFE